RQKNFQEKEKERDDPHRRVRTGERDHNDVKYSEEEQDVGADDRDQKNVIEREEVHELEGEKLVPEPRHLLEKLPSDVIISPHPPRPLFDPDRPRLRLLFERDRIRDVFDPQPLHVDPDAELGILRDSLFVPPAELVEELPPNDEIRSGE